MSAKKRGRPAVERVTPSDVFEAIGAAMFPPGLDKVLGFWLQRLELARLRLQWARDGHPGYDLGVEEKWVSVYEESRVEFSRHAIKTGNYQFFRNLATGIDSLSQANDADRRIRILVADCWVSLGGIHTAVTPGEVAKLANHHALRTDLVTASKVRDIMNSLGLTASARQRKTGGDK